MTNIINNSGNIFRGSVAYTNEDRQDRKKINENITKEGVVINTFIKDPDTYNAGLPVLKTDLPKDMFKKQDKISGGFFNNPLVPLVVAPLVILGTGAALALAYKHSCSSKKITEESKLIPGYGRLIAINNDNIMSLFVLVQDPTRKNLVAAASVIAASAVAFVLKNVVDGSKEILVRKKAADIKRDKEERLIDIETRSFAGKNQIIRSMMAQTFLELTQIDLEESTFAEKNKPLSTTKLSFADFNKKLSFKSKINTKNKKNDETSKQNFRSKTILYCILGAAVLVGSALFAKSIFKNLSAVEKLFHEEETKIRNAINLDLKNISSTKQLEEELKKLKNIPSLWKDLLRTEWEKMHNPNNLSAPSEFFGVEKGKTGFLSTVVAESSSFIYTWLINKTPQTKALAMVMCGATAAGYVGEKTVEAVKEVQVEKANAKTEVELQDRLVQVELQNFHRKKSSYIEPFMEDYREKIKNAKTQEDKKRLKENVLTEIKSGPPFVYS